MHQPLAIGGRKLRCICLLRKQDVILVRRQIGRSVGLFRTLAAGAEQCRLDNQVMFGREIRRLFAANDLRHIGRISDVTGVFGKRDVVCPFFVLAAVLG